ncbi:MAG: hypothetical protein ACFE8P_06175 [Promethearchaeota archaeon]
MILGADGYETDPSDPDTDDDGYDDGYEISQGTNPLDPEHHTEESDDPGAIPGYELSIVVFSSKIALLFVSLSLNRKKNRR